MVEVQCSSCHTRYRVDERVLPEGTPTFKCSRCGHVFTIEPRRDNTAAPPKAKAAPAPRARVTPDEEATPPPPKEEPKIEASASEPPPSQAESPEPAVDIAEPPPEPAPAPKPRTTPERLRPAPAEPKTAKPKISTAELLSRPLPKPSEAAEGENLAFDFSNEDDALEDDSAAAMDEAKRKEASIVRPAAQWTVGTDTKAEEFEADNPGFELDDQPARAPINRPRVPRVPPKRRTNRDEFVDDAEAPVYNAGVSHSARFFLGLLLLVLIGFVGTTVSIHTAPAAARSLLNGLPIVGDRFGSPITPARMVVLHDVHSKYERGKDGRSLLVIEGQAENVTAGPLHTIGIAAALEVAPGKPMARREVYCGNSLATRTVAEMTPHEIDFFQSLPPAAAFKVDASGSCPFVIVFTQPAAGANHFALEITRAEIATQPAGGSNS